MQNIQARIDESVDELVRKLNALAGELAIDAIRRRMQKQQPGGRQRLLSGTPVKVHRKPEEVTALAELLHAAMCKSPGETMQTLSRQLKQPATMLALPAQKLASAGRIKKIGQRQFTRYFPIGTEPKRKQRRRR